MARIKRRTGKAGKERFTVEIRIRGCPPQSATFGRLTDARQWGQKVEAELRQGKYFDVAESRKRTVADLVNRYIKEALIRRRSDQADVKRHLEWWKKELGHYRLCDLKPSLIAEYRDRLSTEPMKPKGKLKKGAAPKPDKFRSPATVGRYLGSLSTAVSCAVKEWQWLSENPVLKTRKPSEPRGRVRYLSDDERESLLAACKNVESKYLYTVVVLALATGGRWGELMKLRWEHVDFKRRTVLFEETKNGEMRSLPLSGHGLEQLKKLHSDRKLHSPYVFARSDGKKPKEIRKKWERAIKEAGLTGFRFHDLRHTCASYLAMQGATLMEISTVLGHKTLQMVKRYSHLSETHVAGVLERMNAVQFAEVERG